VHALSQQYRQTLCRNSKVDYVHACVNHRVDVIGRARTSRKQNPRLKHSKHVDLSLVPRYTSHLDRACGALVFSLPRKLATDMELNPAIATKSTILSLSLFCLVVSCLVFCSINQISANRSCRLYTSELLAFSRQHRRRRPLLSLSSKTIRPPLLLYTTKPWPGDNQHPSFHHCRLGHTPLGLTDDRLLSFLRPST
jgi:hypothetical protein